MTEGNDFSEVYVVIPAKDEERYIDILLGKLIDLGFENIIVVNDNSIDRTGRIAEEREHITVLEHSINLGAGAATQTGIAYAVEKNAQTIVTIDADLQHNPNDLVKLIQKLIEEDYDLVIGSRFLKKNDIPPSRIFFNKGANIISWFLTGKYLTDSQSGLKAFNHKLAKKLDLKYDGFEFCMEIIKVANTQRLRIKEIPVNVTYTQETKNKGQGLKSGLKILGKLLSPFS